MMQPYQSKIADAKPTPTNISTLPPQLSRYSLFYEICISLTHVLILVIIHTLLVMKIICRMETSWGWEKYLSRPGFPSVKIMESRRKQPAPAIYRCRDAYCCPDVSAVCKSHGELPSCPCVSTVSILLYSAYAVLMCCSAPLGRG